MMIETLTIEEFNDYALKHELSYFSQSSYWGNLKHMNGWIPHYVGLKKDGVIVGATLLLAKKIPVFPKYFFYAPRGFLVDYHDFELLDRFVSGIRDYVRKNSGIFVKINPMILYQERDVDGNIVEDGECNQDIVDHLIKLRFQHNGFPLDYGVDLEPRWISVLDLRGKSADQLLKEMRSTTRSVINNSYKHSLELVELKREELHIYKKMMEETGERRGFIDRPLSYYEKMYDEFSPSNSIKFMVVRLNLENYVSTLKSRIDEMNHKIDMEEKKERPREGTLREWNDQVKSIQSNLEYTQSLFDQYGSEVIVAGGVFMTFGCQVVSLFGASYKEFMKYNGQYFLNYEMIKYAIDHGFDTYNFLGITGHFEPDHEMYGLFNFKRGFGAIVTELIGEFTLVVKPFYYWVYKRMLSVYIFLKRFQ